MDMKAAMCLELKSLESDNIALGKMNSTKKKAMMIFIFSQKNCKSGEEKIIDGSRGAHTIQFVT